MMFSMTMNLHVTIGISQIPLSVLIVSKNVDALDLVRAIQFSLN